MKTRCPLCKSKTLTTFLKRNNVPILSNVIMNSYKQAISSKRGTIRLAVCRECEFIFNQVFEPNIVKYGQNYDNTQTYSLIYNEFFNDLVNYLVYKKNIQNSTIVEIGCGKGDFLRKLIEFDEGNTGYGFDPSYIKSNNDDNERLHFQNCYYDAKLTSDMKINAIICRHVIEHIPDPVNLISSLKLGLKNSHQAKIFFETPSIEWMLKNGLIWDFGYEHCSYFTSNSLRFLFESRGFSVIDAKNVFNGQNLWLEATNESKLRKTKIKNHQTIFQLIEKFMKIESTILSHLNEVIPTLKKNGNLAVWGAAGKGVIFTNFIDPHHELIDYLIDINPKKQGKFVAGTGHQIIGIDEIRKHNIKTAIVVNPLYYDEIKSMVNQHDLRIDLIDLVPYQMKLLSK